MCRKCSPGPGLETCAFTTLRQKDHFLLIHLFIYLFYLFFLKGSYTFFMVLCIIKPGVEQHDPQCTAPAPAVRVRLAGRLACVEGFCRKLKWVCVKFSRAARGNISVLLICPRVSETTTSKEVCFFFSRVHWSVCMCE